MVTSAQGGGSGFFRGIGSTNILDFHHAEDYILFEF